MIRTSLAMLMLFAAALCARSADTIVQWTFNSSPPDANTVTGSVLPATGSGTASLVGGATATFFGGTGADTFSVGDNSGWSTTTYPARGAANKTAGALFRVSTAGFENIVIGWAHRLSTTASKYVRFQYSIDGTNFIDGPVIDMTLVPVNTFAFQSVNLGAIAAVDNNPNFAFRMMAEFESTATGSGADDYASMGVIVYAPSGAIRYDLMTVAGTPFTGNRPPSITAIPAQAIRVSTSTGNLPFTIADAETPTESLLITTSSSDQSVIPDHSIFLDGSGSNLTVSVESDFVISGVTDITLTVTDEGGRTATTTFRVTVLPENTPPTFGNTFTNYHTLRDVALPPVPFVIGDLETPAVNLAITTSSSDPALIPHANIVQGGSGANRTLTITPAPGQTGNAVITVTVSDSVRAASRRFNVMVIPTPGTLLIEPFDHANGPLLTNAGGLWITHSGAFGESLIVDGTLPMTAARTEDFHARLIGGPYPPSGGAVLYASFLVNFIGLPVERGESFAYFTQASNPFRGLVFVSTTNSPAGTYRLGIGNATGNITNVSTLNRDLSTGVTHRVVVRYDVGTGSSKLWVDPPSENSPGLSAIDPAVLSTIHAFGFRQNLNMGAPVIDDLRVGLSFLDAVPGAYEPCLKIRYTAGNIEISWPAAATDDGYSLHSASNTGSPANWQPVNQPPARNGAHDTVTLPVAGTRYFQLVK